MLTSGLAIAIYLGANKYFWHVRAKDLPLHTRGLIDFLANQFTNTERPYEPSLPDSIVDLFEGLYPASVRYVEEGIFIDASGTKLANLFVPWKSVLVSVKNSCLELSFSDYPHPPLVLPLPRNKEILDILRQKNSGT